MKKLPMILLVVFLLGLITVAYLGRDRSVIKLEETDSGKTIELSMGDHIEVVLESNPATGYTWEVVSGQDLLEQVSEAEFVAASQQIVGAGGQMRFAFKAVAPGTTSLQLVYLRPFERDVEPQQAFSVQLNVK
jgi:inhibitor of cysteine peptidase